MDRDGLQEALEYADLTSYQSEAYLTLIEHGRLPAADIARRTSIPSSQIYKTLRKLEEMEFIELVDQETLHAEARDPVQILSHLRDRGELLTDAADELEDRWERPPAMEHRVNVVKYADTVIERVRNRLEDTSVAATVALSIEQLESLTPELIAAAESGLTVLVTVYDREGVEERIRDLGLLDAPIQIRLAYIPGPFLAILDRRETYFTPNRRADETYGVIIKDEILSFINHWYFQTCLWSVYPSLESNVSTETTYLGLEGLIRDTAPLVHQGAKVTATVSGAVIETGESCVVSGEIVGFYYPGMVENHSPSLEELSTFSTVFLDTGDGVVSVGSWGAVFEDVEAYKTSIESIRAPPSSAST